MPVEPALRPAEPDRGDRRGPGEAKQDLAAWLAQWQPRYPKLRDWVEDDIEDTLTFYRLPKSHHEHLKSTNMLERLNEEIEWRTRAIRIFPNAESRLRLGRALAVETHEDWREAHRYVNMDDLGEHRKEQLRLAARAPRRRCRGRPFAELDAHNCPRDPRPPSLPVAPSRAVPAEQISGQAYQVCKKPLSFRSWLGCSSLGASGDTMRNQPCVLTPAPCRHARGRVTF
jgi:hypothetical protein